MTDENERHLRDFYEDKALTYPERDEPALTRCAKAVGLARIEGGMSVLDVACKDAVLLEAIQAACLTVNYTGVDISERVIAKNLERGLNGEFVRANILDGLPMADASFDRVFALEIMEHVPRPERLLTEARRLLKPDGRLLLSVPNPYYYMEIVNEVRRRADSDGHLFSFNRANVGALLHHCGFRIEGSAGTCLLLPRSLRHPFRDNRFWVVKKIPEMLACSRVFLCKKAPLA